MALCLRGQIFAWLAWSPLLSLWQAVIIAALLIQFDSVNIDSDVADAGTSLVRRSSVNRAMQCTVITSFAMIILMILVVTNLPTNLPGGFCSHLLWGTDPGQRSLHTGDQIVGQFGHVEHDYICEES